MAAGLAAELKRELGIDAELLPGGRGVFDVLLDGETIFSKYEEHRFPEEGEIPRLIREEGEPWVGSEG